MKDIYSQSELAKTLGIHKNTIQNWIVSGCPKTTKGIDVIELLKWLASERSRINKPVATPQNNPQNLDAKLKQIELQNEKLQIQIDKQKELLVDPEMIKEQLSNSLANLRNALQNIGDTYNCTDKINSAIDRVVEKIDDVS